MKIRPGEAADVIIDTQKSRAEAAKSKEARTTANHAQVSQPGTESADKVEVGATRQITELLKEMDSKSRVEHFKALIESGQYQQPSGEILAGALSQVLDEEIDVESLLNPDRSAEKEQDEE